MNGMCSIPHERITQAWVSGSTSVLANENGFDCVSLGSRDTSGGVIITPRMPQRWSSTAIKPIIVTPDGPYLGRLEGPLDVTPFRGGPLSASSYADPELLDLVGWEKQPSFRPTRGTYRAAVVPTASTMYFPIKGRRSLFVKLVATGATNFFAGLYIIDSTGTLRVLDSKSTAGGAEFAWRPSIAAPGDGNAAAATFRGGFDMGDYLGIQADTAWVSATITASDDL